MVLSRSFAVIGVQRLFWIGTLDRAQAHVFGTLMGVRPAACRCCRLSVWRLGLRDWLPRPCSRRERHPRPGLPTRAPRVRNCLAQGRRAQRRRRSFPCCGFPVTRSLVSSPRFAAANFRKAAPVRGLVKPSALCPSPGTLVGSICPSFIPQVTKNSVNNDLA